MHTHTHTLTLALAAAAATVLLLGTVAASADGGLYTLPQLFNNDCMLHDTHGGVDSPFFNESQVGAVSLVIEPAVLDGLLYNKARTSKYVSTAFNFTSPSGAAFSIPKVGIRLRGFSSRFYSGSKHSFTLNFGHYGGHAPFGLAKIALRGEPFDPTMMREFLTMDTLRSMGVCLGRKSYATLHINGEFWGLFVMLELLDESFLQSRFGLAHDEGLLYKLPLWDTSYMGMDFFIKDVQELILKKTPLKSPYTKSGVYEPLVNLATLVGLSDSAGFPTAMSLALDVPLFLRSMASLTLMFDWDSLFNANNFYLALNARINQLAFIPFDFDMSVGMMLNTTSCGSVYSMACNGHSIPVYNAIMAVPAFRDQYTAYARIMMDELLDGPSAPIQKRLASLRSLIEPYATRTFFNASASLFPPSPKSFADAFTTDIKLPSGVVAGIIPWLESFPADLAAGLEPAPSGAAVAVFSNPTYVSEPSIPVRAVVHGNVPIAGVMIDYMTINMTDGSKTAHTIPATCIDKTSPYSSTWTATITVDESTTQGVIINATVTPTVGEPTVYPPTGSFRSSLYAVPGQFPLQDKQ